MRPGANAAQRVSPRRALCACVLARALQAAATRPKEEEEPIWIRRERERGLQAKEGKDLPFFAYLLFSAIVAIAAVSRGSFLCGGLLWSRNAQRNCERKLSWLGGCSALGSGAHVVCVTAALPPASAVLPTAHQGRPSLGGPSPSVSLPRCMPDAQSSFARLSHWGLCRWGLSLSTPPATRCLAWSSPTTHSGPPSCCSSSSQASPWQVGGRAGGVGGWSMGWLLLAAALAALSAAAAVLQM